MQSCYHTPTYKCITFAALLLHCQVDVARVEYSIMCDRKINWASVFGFHTCTSLMILCWLHAGNCSYIMYIGLDNCNKSLLHFILICAQFVNDNAATDVYGQLQTSRRTVTDRSCAVNCSKHGKQAGRFATIMEHNLTAPIPKLQHNLLHNMAPCPIHLWCICCYFTTD